MNKILKLNDNESYKLIDNKGVMCEGCCFLWKSWVLLVEL